MSVTDTSPNFIFPFYGPQTRQKILR